MLDIISFVVLFLFLAYLNCRCWISSLVMAFALIILLLDSSASVLVSVILTAIFVPVLLILNVPFLRRLLLAGPVFARVRKKLPHISETEEIILKAGNTWWEQKLFTGSPPWKELLAMPKPGLSDEEQLFLDEQVEALCQQLDHPVGPVDTYGLTAGMWDYLKKEKFFGMVIAKEHGGLGFSAQAHSAVVKKIATRSLSLAVITMVPNSLGPGELISNYGTDAQKTFYLPRLALGEDLPCFGLTALHAGSDATSLTDSGVVGRGIFEGKEVLGITLNFEKRYITLAPIATLLGLAFKLYDPDHLLGIKEDLGINIAMIPLPFAGVEHERRHWPMQLSFPNGPVSGEDVFIPLDYLLGGEKMLGRGWEMLVECLSIGRAISLPALSCASASVAYLSTGAYAQIRKQFNLPIAAFEAVREALSEIAGFTYMLEATRLLTASAVDQGVSPTLASAIVKYHMTEMQRKITQHAMDIHAGKAVQAGPRNYLMQSYLGIPVGITVEGANILTRGLIIFGQGAMRCHPYFLKEIECAAEPDHKKALKQFDRVLRGHLGYLLNNAVRTTVMGVTGEFFMKSAMPGPLSQYYKSLTRMSAALALVSDVTASLLGAQLKRKETLSARLGDVLSHLYLASAVIKYFEDQGQPEKELVYVRWCLEKNLASIQQAFDEFFRNFKNPVVRRMLRFMVFPWGRSYVAPKDSLSNALLDSMLDLSYLRSRFSSLCYLGKTGSPLSSVEQAFKASRAVVALDKKFHDLLREGKISSTLCFEEQLTMALEHQYFTTAEVHALQVAHQLVEEAIAVDEFNMTLTEVLN